MAQHNKIGSFGEQLALKELQRNGFEILETNWRYHPLEIDIIAQKENALHIVEVKTRSTSDFGHPEQFVSRAKQKRLIKAAHEYILLKDLDLEVYFDIVSVVVSDNTHEVVLIEDAFTPSW